MRIYLSFPSPPFLALSIVILVRLMCNTWWLCKLHTWVMYDYLPAQTFVLKLIMALFWHVLSFLCSCHYHIPKPSPSCITLPVSSHILDSLLILYAVKWSFLESALWASSQLSSWDFPSSFSWIFFFTSSFHWVSYFLHSMSVSSWVYFLILVNDLWEKLKRR